MSDEIVPAEVVNIQLSQNSVSAMSDRIKLIKEFVGNHLRNDINGDYAKIPGTPKPSLLKPGAEKLLLLFNLGYRMEIVSSTVDLYSGEVNFLAKCIVFRKQGGESIGECFGYCSNQEGKYSKRAPADIINTILKMAQKRALVGATLSSTGASDYFTQDMEDIGAQREVDTSKFESQPVGDLADYEVQVGKFKGKKFSEINEKELAGYCQFIKEKNTNIEGKLKELLDKAREFLRDK